MPTGALAYEHLDCSEPEQPVIAGKRFKVRQLIAEHVAYGWSAEELALNHPQLTLGEVYSALAYYADHRDELDRQIAESADIASKLHAEPRHRRISSRLANR